MNMLSSLKALLFASTATRGAGEGGGVSVPAATMDFAQLLEGSIADATPVGPVADGAPNVAVDGVEAPQADPVEGEAVQAAALQPGSRAVWRNDGPALPPGLALGLVKHAAAGPASASNGRPAEIAAEVQDEASEPMPDALSPESAASEAAKPVKNGDALPKAERIARKAEAKGRPVEADALPTTDEAQTAQIEGEEKQADQPDLAIPAIVMAAPQPVPAAPVVASIPDAMPATIPVSVEVKAEVTAPVIPSLRAAPVADKAVTEGALLPKLVAEAPLAAETLKPETPTHQAKRAPERAPHIGRSQIEPSVGANGPVPMGRNAEPLAGVVDPLPVAPEKPAAPVLNGKSVKAEALALLQIVRDQVAGRQSGEAVHVGEQVSVTARTRSVQLVPATEAVSSPLAAPLPDSVAAVPVACSQPVSPQVIAPAAPAIDLSATLGAQVVDMGVSGQWIDGLARDIAGLSASGAQGRFHINTGQLGAVQVDIRQGSEGAAVNLTVASEAAEIALRQDSDRLKLDAGLAAVRIAEVKIERAAPVAEASRADSAGQQSSQQQSQNSSSHAQSAWQNGGQAMGQSSGQQGRWQGRENNGFATKSSNDPAVLNHADTRREGGEPQRARYA